MPKILWMSPFSLHDTSSGASIRCKYMLLALQSRGYVTWSCSSFIFDNKKGSVQAFGDLDSMFDKDPSEVFVFDEDNIHYIYTRCQSTNIQDMTLDEGQLFFNTFKQTINEFMPDIILGYGTTPASAACFAEARRRGIATVYNLTTCHCNQYLFPNIDLILTDSEATAQLYKDRDHMNLVPCGPFINTAAITAPEHKRIFITMINPSISKGVAIFAKLAQYCRLETPEVNFLVVNTRENFNEVLPYLHTQGDPTNHPLKARDFTNVFTIDAQKDMRAIYSITSVLVAPSIGFESWGLVASEAVLNNIPVLASSIGGLREAMCGLGETLDIPEACLQDFTALPTDLEIRPWFEALQRLRFQEYTPEQKAHAQKMLSLENCLRLTHNAFVPLLKKLTPVNLEDLDIDQIKNEDLKKITF